MVEPPPTLLGPCFMSYKQEILVLSRYINTLNSGVNVMENAYYLKIVDLLGNAHRQGEELIKAADQREMY